ncbi:sugar transferase [Robertkochia solimangrovi]|uniref:sugar transferase n=1 Tax=Robertkochia solimangrovi TaxID=2213046 RepID=UPI00117EC4FE|nr:sugar transferase [Robertkochia solimangrovi]TRZ45008.1 lipid carrier--UDP-N-acetylgalactosaminyltransferase [Robertkochia solimangrovi]
MYRKFIKRIIDLTASGFGLLILSPLIVTIAVLLYFFNDGKPFFTQIRPGKDGKLFRIIKFRSMNEKKDKHGELLPDADRLTAVGKFIRKTSLDEIPQLINVFIGDMSLIGPRPLLTSYLDLYSEYQMRRHEVRPGITGWAQVNGRNAISWKEKFDLDIYYVDHCSASLDLKIIWLTFKKVLKQEDISSATHATMEFFNGNN